MVDSPEAIARWMNVIRAVRIPKELLIFCARIVAATHPERDSELAQKYIRFGASPRAMQALVLAGKARAFLHGRTTVAREDIVDVAPSCLQHRVLLNFEAESEGVRVQTVLERLLRRV